jgi:hypothetical protein
MSLEPDSPKSAEIYIPLHKIAYPGNAGKGRQEYRRLPAVSLSHWEAPRRTRPKFIKIDARYEYDA